MAESSASIAVMTYNILVGGRDLGMDHGRLERIAAVMAAARPDIVGVVEANDPAAFRALAAEMDMESVMGLARTGSHVGVMSRWPILAWHQHDDPSLRKPFLEAEIAIPGEPQPWHIFVGHLTADFAAGAASERRRLAEARILLAAMAECRRLGQPHLAMGDFNSLAPGEPFDAVRLITRIIEIDAMSQAQGVPQDGMPHLQHITPGPLRKLTPLIKRIPTMPWLAGLVAFAAHLYLPRLVYPAIAAAGYVECLRQSIGDPRAIPPTCPLPSPAGRIDYLWASPDLAQRLRGCAVLTDEPGQPVLTASDHAPVLARFTPILVAPEATGRSVETSRIMAVEE